MHSVSAIFLKSNWIIPEAAAMLMLKLMMISATAGYIWDYFKSEAMLNSWHGEL
ncbi:MAG: hypothetical protein JSR32_10945 [Proteobacteria bacterium]|nr:hypothetical protein [Pseudomonadota bacterium]